LKCIEINIANRPASKSSSWTPAWWKPRRSWRPRFNV